MKQLSTRTIAIIALVAVAILAIGVFAIQDYAKVPTPVVENGEGQENQGENTTEQAFVTDVNMNVENWQMKETEFFTIKFPEEWYFLESKVITNNQDFNIDKYADIGLFTEGKYLFTSVSEGVESEPIPLQNDEVIISFRGTPTSNSGTPQDSMDSKIGKQSANGYECAQDSIKQLPLRGNCFFTTDYDEQIHTYYVITEEISLAITARTTADTMIDEDIIEKIVDSIKIQ